MPELTVERVVIVDEQDGRYTLWCDSQVDYPFPAAAELIEVFTGREGKLDALRKAFAIADELGSLLRGVIQLKGPTRCHKLSETDGQFCCGYMYRHGGSCFPNVKWTDNPQYSKAQQKRKAS